eukprot:gene13256-19096_t
MELADLVARSSSWPQLSSEELPTLVDNVTYDGSLPAASTHSKSFSHKLPESPDPNEAAQKSENSLSLALILLTKLDGADMQPRHRRSIGQRLKSRKSPRPDSQVPKGMKAIKLASLMRTLESNSDCVRSSGGIPVDTKSTVAQVQLAESPKMKRLYIMSDPPTTQTFIEPRPRAACKAAAKEGEPYTKTTDSQTQQGEPATASSQAPGKQAAQKHRIHRSTANQHANQQGQDNRSQPEANQQSQPAQREQSSKQTRANKTAKTSRGQAHQQANSSQPISEDLDSFKKLVSDEKTKALLDGRVMDEDLSEHLDS